MRLTIAPVVLMLLTAETLLATRSGAQELLDARVSLSVHDARISKIIALISRQTGIKFLYSSDAIHTDRKLDCQVKDKKLRQVLEEYFRPLEIQYRIVNENILLYAAAVHSPPDPADQKENPRLVTGAVLNEKGEPVPDATISVRGAAPATTTGPDGHFSLSLTGPDANLLVTCIGYRPQDVSIRGRERISILLFTESRSLDDVVVIGYGQQKRTDLTGSVSVVSPGDFEDQPMIRMEDALKGRAAGVIVQTTGGAPGAPSRIRIRGANSINGNNDPLYVVDGFIGADITTISPNDIASMEVLKDASATAIFGSRGANGVVIVTTRKGTEGSSQISTDIFYSFNQVRKKMALVNGVQYMQTINERNATLDLAPQFTQAAIDSVQGSGGTDWQNAILRTGATQHYQLAYSGGSAKTRVYLSGSFSTQNGIIINSWYKRYGIRTNINTNVSKRMDLVFSMNSTFQQSRNNYNYSGHNTPYGEAIVYSPNLPVWDSVKGDYTEPPSYGPISVNPVFSAKEWNFDNNLFTVLANITGNYSISPHFRISISGGIDGFNFNNPYFKRYYPGNLQNTTEAGYDNGYTWSWQNTNMITYDNTFGGRHHLNISGIYEQQVATGHTSRSWATAFPTNNIGYNNLGLGATQQAGSGYSQWSLQSWLGRINYTLRDKYLLTATMRADGSSKFQGRNKYGYFPSGAIAWKISEEPFIAAMQAFQTLKLRASYGVTGSQAVAPYQTLNILSPAQGYPFNGQSLTVGIGPGTVSNPNLKWESTTQTDIGLDVGILKNRLHATLDYYYKKTTDLLLAVTIPLYAGGNSRLRNVGSMQNRGFELQLNGILMDLPACRITSTFNFSASRNKVLSLGKEAEIFTDGGYADLPAKFVSPYIVRVGQPLGGFRGLIFQGLWQQKDAAEAALFGNKPGDSRYKDLNGDHLIDGNDMTTISNALPRYNWGWNTDLRFHQVELNLFFNAVSGNHVWNYTRFIPIAGGGDVKNPTSADILRHWTPVSTNTDIPGFSNSNITYGQSSKFIESGSFIRLNNLTLGYSLAPVTLKRLKISQAKFYISAQNLWVITGYKGLDPELSTTPVYSDIATGIDNATYPPFKTYTVGCRVIF